MKTRFCPKDFVNDCSPKIKTFLILHNTNVKDFLWKNFLIFFPEKNHSEKYFLYFGKWKFVEPKNRIKPFYTLNKLNKSPLGETEYLANFYYLLAAQAYSFLINHASLEWVTGCHAMTVVTKCFTPNTS